MAPTSDKVPPAKTLPEFSFRRHDFWQHLKNFPDMTANVVIIGGGIVGAGLLRELALQDIPLVFLFEKNDFASATSSASSKLIHAGIRYLELMWNALKRFRFGEAVHHFRFVLQASRERKILGALAPHVIKPKRIYLVLGKKDKRFPLSVMGGVWFYTLIQFFQGQFFSQPKTETEFDKKKAKASFSFWDSETDDARLVIENLQSAHGMGAYAMNYVEVVDHKTEGELVLVTLKNKENGQTLSLKTRILVNATGPFIDEVRGKNSHLIDRVEGAHIDVYPAITNGSYYVSAGDGRLVFFLKRDEDGLIYTRIGTTERPLQENEPTDGVRSTQTEIDYLIGLAREFFPNAKINDETILRRDSGIRPLRAQNKESAFHKSREHEIIVEGNIYHMVGVKLTDFRRVANELLKKIPWGKLNLRLADPSRSQRTALRSVEAERLYVEEDMVEMIRRTMIVHWKDYVQHRRGLGPRVLKNVNSGAYKREFEVMKEIMGWNEERAEREWNSI